MSMSMDEKGRQRNRSYVYSQYSLLMLKGYESSALQHVQVFTQVLRPWVDIAHAVML